jgi:hypothetical protein
MNTRQNEVLLDLCNSIIYQKEYFLKLSDNIGFLDFYTNGSYISLKK